ncbi:MAG: LysM peptidoglycan-binding domain-containing protein [Candidatus Fimenecus sp.]
MKGSKKFGKSILVIALSLVLIISAVAPLAVMGSENYGGSKGTAMGNYRYYSVRSGETLASIAQKNGVTISDIMTYNNLSSEDTLYRGQVLKLPVTTANSSSGIVSTRLTIKAKDANIKDLVSSIAYNAGYTVIFKGAGTETVTVDLKDVSPLKALDYVTRLVGLSYLKDGNTVMISTADELNTTFVDSLILTKFSFKYITFDELISQATALGLNNVKVVSQSNNKRDVWISAYPKEMAKLHELAEILDSSENISVGSSNIASAFTPIELNYISASEFSSLLDSLGLHSGITTESRPMTLFVYVSGTAMADIMKIKQVVDVPASAATNGATGDGTGSGDSGTTVAPGATTFEKIDLVNISRSDAEALIAKYAQDVTTYGHDRMTKSLWLFGTAAAISNAKAIINQIDSNVASASSTIHTYVAQNCTVDELMSRLSNVSYENVQFYTYDHSSITNSIIVYCDDVTWNNEIHDLLVALDTVDTGEKMWIPLESITKDTAVKATTAVEDRFILMQSLYPEVFGGVEYQVVALVVDEGSVDAESGQVTGSSYKGVIYVKATSDQAKRMNNLLDALDNA